MRFSDQQDVIAWRWWYSIFAVQGIAILGNASLILCYRTVSTYWKGGELVSAVEIERFQKAGTFLENPPS